MVVLVVILGGGSVLAQGDDLGGGRLEVIGDTRGGGGLGDVSSLGIWLVGVGIDWRLAASLGLRVQALALVTSGAPREGEAGAFGGGGEIGLFIRPWDESVVRPFGFWRVGLLFFLSRFYRVVLFTRGLLVLVRVWMCRWGSAGWWERMYIMCIYRMVRGLERTIRPTMGWGLGWRCGGRCLRLGV